MSNAKQNLVKNRATNIDNLVSKKLRMRRMTLGISQGELGQALCVSTQQVQKYENAINRISSGRLFVIADFLKVPINYFFNNSNNIINPIYSFFEEGEKFTMDSITSQLESERAVDAADLNDEENNTKSEDYIFKLVNLFDQKGHPEIEEKEVILLITEFIAIKESSIRKNIINLIKNINRNSKKG